MPSCSYTPWDKIENVFGDRLIAALVASFWMEEASLFLRLWTSPYEVTSG